MSPLPHKGCPGMQGQSSVREVDLQTGEVIRQVDTERRDFGEGLSSIGDRQAPLLLTHF